MRLVAVVVLFLSLWLVAPAEAGVAGIVNQTPPAVSGTPKVREVLHVTPGTWDPPDVTLTYQWRRDGVDIDGANSTSHRVKTADVGHRLTVIETATKDADSLSAESKPTTKVRKGDLVADSRPTISGVVRFRHKLRAHRATWRVRPTSTRYQWLRNGAPIKGAHAATYALGVDDFGQRITVRVVGHRDGFAVGTIDSRATRPVGYSVPTSHLVTYRIATRGSIHADLQTFAKLAQQTYDDPRGWRGAGVGFKRVKRGGDFILTLSEARYLPSFGYPCDSTYSCRVGNHVIINQTRWLTATSTWRAAHRTLRDYRNLVVDHETGHWLGHRHEYCGGSGKLAPVMMQQSKGLHGCKANPWPLGWELTAPRFH